MEKGLITVAFGLCCTASAHAQAIAELFFLDCDNPLTIECTGWQGLPDGSVSIDIMWDQNNNGADGTDELTPVGFGPGEANYNSFLINGEEALGCAGTYYTLEFLGFASGLPQPPRFWLRICNWDAGTMWKSSTFLLANGPNSVEHDAGDWLCHDSLCAGCPIPLPITGFVASDTSCTSYDMSWDAYPMQEDVDSIVIYRSSTDTVVATLPWFATQYSDLATQPGVYAFMIAARRICEVPVDTSMSVPALDAGVRLEPPRRPLGDTIRVTTPDAVCGALVVRWLTPTSVASVDSFCVFQDGIEVGRTWRGFPGQIATDTVYTPLHGPHNFSVSGWSEECGYGERTPEVSGAAYNPPAQVVGLTATIGELNTTLNWQAVAEAEHYYVYRDSTLIGTTNTPAYVDSTATPYVLFNYSVAAAIESNPPQCELGQQSPWHSGMRTGSTGAEEEIEPALPRSVELLQNYPNPFNATTTIAFGVPSPMRARVELYDTGGRLVNTLYDAPASGRTSVRVSLEGMPSGIYIYRLITPDVQLSNKMLLIR